LNKNNTIIPAINFKLHLILFLVTGTLWAPFYNLLCFLSLNKLAKLPLPEGVPPPKNSAVSNFLLALSFVGAPFAFFRRFQLLNSYIAEMNSHLIPLPKTKDEDGKEIIQERLNCLKPGNYVGFVIAAFFLICTVVTSYVLVSYFIVNYPSWGNEALLILLPVGIATTFVGLGFCVRTAKEEQKWVKAFNTIAEELVI